LRTRTIYSERKINSLRSASSSWHESLEDSMAKLYAQKITNNEINAFTGETWKLEDVPMLWRSEVEAIVRGEV
jgi:hypothetical protein